MTLPSLDYRKTTVIKPNKVSAGLDAGVDYLMGVYQRRESLRELMFARGAGVHVQAKQHRNLSEHKLKARLADMQTLFRRQKSLLPEQVDAALALLVEMADRTLGMRPFPVQAMCALALDSGYLAEMRTGEGKSLTATLAGVLAGWTGRPCHILTTNEYLAGRDATGFSEFYEACGVSVGAVIGQMEERQRQSIYRADVVYTTSKELLADFLRDRIKLGALYHPQRRLLREIMEPYRRLDEAMVLRGIDTAIIDEADSVMVDEAVTPLIISARQENKWLVEAAEAAHAQVSIFEAKTDFTVDEKYREITFTDEGYERLAELSTRLPGIWRGTSRREEIMRQAIIAREFYKLNQHYVLEDNKIVIVDEFTGRLMHNRSWGNGLHQAVESKEGLALTDPTETLARLSFQRFFRVFRRLSGMTGTAKEASGEFWHIYGLPVMTIPPNRPVVRESWEPSHFVDSESKWQAIAAEIIAVRETGRPVLVGTKSVKSSEEIALRLAERRLPYRLLNAVNHAEEATIVAEAGGERTVTIATNMAGRGTDIKLSPKVAGLGGLHVIIAERNDSGRIDRQLIGRCGRQGDPGSTRIFASLEDDLMVRYGQNIIKKGITYALQEHPEKGQIAAKMAFDRAQKTAEDLASKQRQSVLRTDTWLDEALIFAGSDGVV
ncbi:MAG: preprotein translocase subunit SecA [Urechidicola sp.]